MRTVVQSGIALCVALAGAAAQTTPADGAFDVASIKPAAAGVRGYSIQPLHDRLSARNVTLKHLVSEAYHVYEFQISGGPKWIDSDRFDVEAKASIGSPTRRQLREMLRKLLTDRFALTVRQETKEMPVYAIEVEKGGVKIAAAKHPDAAPMFRVYQRRQITAENSTLEYLTEALSILLGKPVLDETGLEGTFDYKLEWSPDELQVQSSEAPPAPDGAAPSLTRAIKDQMGLKLVSKRGPVEFILVESAQKPAAN